MLDNKNLLITGGTGSFGRAFMEKVLKSYPKINKLIIMSRDELKRSQLAQIYDPNKIQFELYSRIRLFEKLGVVLGIRSNDQDNFYNNYSFGLSYSVR